MVYNIKKSNGAPLVSIPDSTQDTTTTSLILPGKNAVNFGQSIDQNFVDLLQNFSNTSPPPSPQQGQLWYDSVNMDLRVYDGAKWQTVMSPFDGASGITSMRIGPNDTGVTIVISQYQIVTVISADRIPHSDCPDSIIYNDISYAFAIRFPNGIYPGINLATDPSHVVQYWMNGNSTYANALVHSRTIHINGSVAGQFKFDGTSDVNVTVSDSNVYVVNSAGYTTTTTVAGTYTKVRVGDNGRILAGNNITASDVVTALGYTPYNGANANVNAVPNTIVSRDDNANFAANIVVARSIIATRFEGTAANADVLSTSRTIFVNGDMAGNVSFDGSSNVTMTSNLIASGTSAGTYTKVYVDDRGRVRAGGYSTDVPLLSIILYAETTVPDEWTICDGTTVLGDNNSAVTTPNLTAAAAMLSQGIGATVKYIMKYKVLPTDFDLTPGELGVSPSTTTSVVPSRIQALAPAFSGGVAHTIINSGFSNIEIGTVGRVISNQEVTFTNTSFMDTEYFDSLAYIMGLGDTNGIMFSNDDVWKNFASLTIQDIRDNLKLRASENLPAFAGKYMLPVRLIDQQSVNLSIPSNFAFSPLLQDQLVSSITSNFAHQLSVAGIAPSDNNLFGCHYLGSASAWIAVLKGGSTNTVSNVLHTKGYYTTTTSQLESYSRNQLTLILAQILQIARDEIIYRKSIGYNVIVAGQYVTSDNSNTIVTGASVNGYRIGNDSFEDQHGGYFPDYQNITPPTSGSALVSASGAYGSAGVVTLSLADAGACALAAVLQTANPTDQAGIAQLCVNRIGAQASGITTTFGGTNGFDCATVKDGFSALSSAIYGPNSNTTASAIYGGLSVNIDYLKSALGTIDQEEMKVSLASLFGATETVTGTLTSVQLQRIAILRNQVYTNGPEMDLAQSAIGAAVNFVAPRSDATMITSPFGLDASGYVTLTPISGYFIPNTSDATGPAPAPSPASLLNRVLKNRIRRPPIEPGSKTWGTPGNYQFSMPANHTVTIEAWGAGGGGGPSGGSAGSRGGDSSIIGSGVALIAGGGGGGSAGYYRRGFGTGGPGGTASGGTTNLDGNPGGSGQGSARGGNSPNGGTGGASATVAVGTYQGSNGNFPGGGGGGGYSNDGSKDPSYQGGGGGGSGAYALLYSKNVGENTVFDITVGAGGSGSGAGAGGLVTVTWN